MSLLNQDRDLKLHVCDIFSSVEIYGTANELSIINLNKFNQDISTCIVTIQKENIIFETLIDILCSNLIILTDKYGLYPTASDFTTTYTVDITDHLQHVYIWIHNRGVFNNSKASIIIKLRKKL